MWDFSLLKSDNNPDLKFARSRIVFYPLVLTDCAPETVDFNSNELYIRELTFDSPKQKVEFPKPGEKLE